MDPFAKIKSSKIGHLIVDAGGFIKLMDIRNVGENIYSLPEVISEIKDKKTKERLAFLPYEIRFREPPADLLKKVSDFAKKTGDYASLSATDVKVIALTLLLEKEFNGGLDHIKEEPRKTKTIVHAPINNTYGDNVRQASVPGFFLPKTEESTASANDPITLSELPEGKEPSLNKSEPEEDVGAGSALTKEQITVLDRLSDLKLSSEGDEQLSSDDGEDVSDSESIPEVEENAEEDDAGWITPRNIKDVYRQMGRNQEESKKDIHVACLTTDFSMQNVMMQMGLHVISIDGMLIKSLRTYVLRCFGCFKVTHNMEKKFCPWCGNPTLKRVCVTTDKNGNQKYHISTRRPLNIRGTKFSLPLPKGGKHAINPILCEDQPQPHFKASRKSLQKLNVFDPDYAARDSPFLTTDLTSRASLLGRRGNAPHSTMQPWMARNPNAVKRPKK